MQKGIWGFYYSSNIVVFGSWYASVDWPRTLKLMPQEVVNGLRTMIVREMLQGQGCLMPGIKKTLLNATYNSHDEWTVYGVLKI